MNAKVLPEQLLSDLEAKVLTKTGNATRDKGWDGPLTYWESIVLRFRENLEAKALKNMLARLKGPRETKAGMVSSITRDPSFGDLEEMLKRKYMHGLVQKSRMLSWLYLHSSHLC